METISASESKPKCSLSQLIRSLGTGIMMAAAAVGGSHLVASTKAGAIYGWQLAALILLVNFLNTHFSVPAYSTPWEPEKVWSKATPS